MLPGACKVEIDATNMDSPVELELKIMSVLGIPVGSPLIGFPEGAYLSYFRHRIQHTNGFLTSSRSDFRNPE